MGWDVPHWVLHRMECATQATLYGMLGGRRGGGGGEAAHHPLGRQGCWIGDTWHCPHRQWMEEGHDALGPLTACVPPASPAPEASQQPASPKGSMGCISWRCSGVSSCPGSSSPLPSHPDAGSAFHSPRQHWGLLPSLFHDPRTSPGSWLPCRCHISPSRACPPQLPLLMAWFPCELGASQTCLA